MARQVSDLPQKDLVPVGISVLPFFDLRQLFHLARRPVFDTEIMGHDAGAGLELSLKIGSHHFIEPGEHVKRYHGRRRIRESYKR